MNEIENKQIEEMARKIDYAINNECKLNNGGTCGDCLFDNKGDWNCQSKMMASFLHGEGYRNVKDKVVLDKEEWEVLHNDYAKSLYNARQDERKKMQEENGQLRLENNDLEAENNKLKEELRKASELKAETIKLAKQETAREILAKIKEYAIKCNALIWHVYTDDIEEIAEEYGVEVE
jgi:hypothetical protein